MFVTTTLTYWPRREGVELFCCHRSRLFAQSAKWLTSYENALHAQKRLPLTGPRTHRGAREMLRHVTRVRVGAGYHRQFRQGIPLRTSWSMWTDSDAPKFVSR